jgi:aspartate aminotransferase
LLKPYWTSYPAIVELAGASAVYLETQASDGFECRPEILRRALSPASRWLLLNSPCNPTATVYSGAGLKQLAAVLDDYPHVHVLIDGVYDELVFDGRAATLLEVAPRLADRIVLLNSFSKSFAMTGWRVGYAVGPAAIIRKMTQIQMHTLNCAAAPSQIAALAALTTSPEYPQQLREAYRRRRDVLVEALGAAQRLLFRLPAAGLFVFADARPYLSASAPADDAALCDLLLDEARVNVIPGRSFGAPGYLRISFTADAETLTEGARRVTTLLNRLTTHASSAEST